MELIDKLQLEIVLVKVFKVDAVKQAKSIISLAIKNEILELLKKYVSLRIQSNSREKELCRIIGIDVSSNKSQEVVDHVRQQFDHFRVKLNETETLTTAVMDSAKSSTTEHVKEKDSMNALAMEKEISRLREECEFLRVQVSSKEQSIISRLLGIDVNAMKRELDRLREKLNESENLLSIRNSDLATAAANNEAAATKFAAKDKVMSELTKCFSNIQKSGQVREEELKEHKFRAEAKASELEGLLFKSRNEITLLMKENESLKKAIEDLKSKTTVVEKVVNDLKSEVFDQKEQCNHFSVAFQVEKGLRARAEVKELEERNILSITQKSKMLEDCR